MNNKQEILNEIQILKEKIEGLEKMANEPDKKDSGWGDVIELFSTYFCIVADGNVMRIQDCDSSMDRRIIANYNRFATKEKAEQTAKQQLLGRKLQKFADENNGEFEEVKWFIDFEGGKLGAEYDNLEHADFGQVYFSSKMITIKCIYAFRDELTEYFKSL